VFKRRYANQRPIPLGAYLFVLIDTDDFSGVYLRTSGTIAESRGDVSRRFNVQAGDKRALAAIARGAPISARFLAMSHAADIP